MDERILINHQHRSPRSEIRELAGWSPGPPGYSATGPVDRLEPVSLVIPTFFNAELKRRSLCHLLTGLSRCQSVQEIVLVSSDGERQDFSDLKAVAGGRPIRVVESDPHNRGKSRNAGAAAASCPHLLFLDDDMLLRDWRVVDVLLSRLLESGQDAAMFPRRHYARFPVLFDPHTLQQVIDLWRTDADAGASPFLYDPLVEGTPDMPMLFCFPGCFMLIRRDAYERLRGFTEEFVGWGFEDTEFGLRALQQLHVLNLFRSGEPLLHIDHPVSPYKSEEHNANCRKFYRCLTRLDLHLFCRRVFLGADFAADHDLLGKPDRWMEPLRRVTARGVPLNPDEAQSWWQRVARQRMARHLGPLPKFVALHGSRAQGTAAPGDDYDVLCVYDGPVQEFFVTAGPERVEMECADQSRFDYIATHPAIHSFTGPMELAKLARVRLLWGDRQAWREWTFRLLAKAMENGWCYWLVLGLGLRRHASKYGPMMERYFKSLVKLRAHAMARRQFQVNGEGDFSDEAALVLAACHALDQFQPDWRERLRSGEAVFEFQVPEVWTALRQLSELPRAVGLDLAETGRGSNAGCLVAAER